MKTKFAFLALLTAGFLFLCGVSNFFSPSTYAAPALQLTNFPTPTPGADGRIVYIVQEGDTLWRISAVTGVSLENLRALNNLGADDIIAPGQQILLGFGGPTLPTLDPNAAPTVIPPGFTPTPTAGPSNGIVCILLYNDVNGDATRQETEFGVFGGAINLANDTGSLSQTGETTDATEVDGFGNIVPVRVCFQQIPVGKYTISVAIPDGYNPTTFLNYELELEGGDEAFLDFGAQLSTAGIEANPPPEEGGRSPVMGIIGGAFILGGIGLAVYVFLFSGGRKITRVAE